MKIGSAAAIFITFPLLQLMGFDPKGQGVDTGLQGLAVLFAAVPAGMSIIASFIVWGFPLTAERHAEIRAGLAARDMKEPGLAEAAPEMGSEPLLTKEVNVAVRPAE